MVCVCFCIMHTLVGVLYIAACLKTLGGFPPCCFGLNVWSVERRGLFLPTAAAHTVSHLLIHLVNMSVTESGPGLRNMIQLGF